MPEAEERVIRLRYPGTCRSCRGSLPAGVEARWYPGDRAVACLRCPGEDPPADLWAAPQADGVAGRSAQAVADRRAQAREGRIRGRFPRLGGLIIALSEPPQSTRAWAQGAEGERTVETCLRPAVAVGTISVLHDRNIPGSKANLDHIVIGPSGVYVVDTKRYLRKRIERKTEGGSWVLGGRARLVVGGRDQARLLDGAARQAELVRAAIDDLAPDPPIPVRPVLCFVDGAWGLLSDAFDIAGTLVTHPRDLLRRVTRPGDLGGPDRRTVAAHLAARFPEA